MGRMRSENLKRYYERIFIQIRVNFSIQNVHSCVVRRRGKQRIFLWNATLCEKHKTGKKPEKYIGNQHKIAP